MITEESAMQVDWRSNFQESNALTVQPTSGVVSPGLPTANDAEPETSVVQLSAVLIIILVGTATTFAAAAITVFLAMHG